MQQIAVFPGSFDPFTKGHESVVNRFIPLFDQVIIAVGVNSTKKSFFTTESRINHIKTLYKNQPVVTVEPFEGLTVDFCKSKKAAFLIRGMRNTTDFEFEKSIAQMNYQMSGIETLFVITELSVSAIHASIVREIKKNQGEISHFVTNPELLIIQDT